MCFLFSVSSSSSVVDEAEQSVHSNWERSNVASSEQIQTLIFCLVIGQLCRYGFSLPGGKTVICSNRVCGGKQLICPTGRIFSFSFKNRPQVCAGADASGSLSTYKLYKLLDVLKFPSRLIKSPSIYLSV